MASCVALQAQLISIMEVLSKAAVAQICRVVEEGYAELRLEVSRRKEENETLRMELCKHRIQTETQQAADTVSETTSGREVCGKSLCYIGKSEKPPVSPEGGYYAHGRMPSADGVKGHSMFSIKEEDLDACDVQEEAIVRLDIAQEDSVCTGAHAEELCETSSSVYVSVGETEGEWEPGADRRRRGHGCGELEVFGSSLDRVETGHPSVSHAADVNLSLAFPEQPWSRRGTEFVCGYCRRSFRSPKSLAAHKRVHGRERPFCCVHCGKTFAHLSNLLTHERTHTGEKPFMCIECGKSFADPGYLKRHQSVHTGEKPFSCKDCGRSFSFSNNLIRHRSIHSKKAYH